MPKATNGKSHAGEGGFISRRRPRRVPCYGVRDWAPGGGRRVVGAESYGGDRSCRRTWRGVVAAAAFGRDVVVVVVVAAAVVRGAGVGFECIGVVVGVVGSCALALLSDKLSVQGHK